MVKPWGAVLRRSKAMLRSEVGRTRRVCGRKIRAVAAGEVVLGFGGEVREFERGRSVGVESVCVMVVEGVESFSPCRLGVPAAGVPSTTILSSFEKT